MATGMLWQKYKYKQRKNIYQLQDGGYLAWEARVSDRWEGISLVIHLTPEQHGFELCGFTYMRIFFNRHTGKFFGGFLQFEKICR